jgi:hypothetical protein
VGLFSLRLLSQWRNLLPNGIELVLEAGMTDDPKRHEATAGRKTLIPAGSEQIFSILVDPPGENVRREWFPGWPVEIDRRLWDSDRCIKVPPVQILADPFKEAAPGRFCAVAILSKRRRVKIMFCEHVKVTNRTVLVGACSVTWSP